MGFQVEERQYGGALAFLREKHLEFYKRFRRHYHEKKGVVPGMTEQQYLMWVADKMGKRARTRLLSLDESLVDSDEIRRFEELLKSSEELQEAARQYADVQQAAHYLTKKDKKKLEQDVVDEIHENMEDKDRREYNKRRVTVLIGRLNLGPWTLYPTGYGEGVEGVIERNRALFQANPDIAVRLYEKYIESGIQGKRTIKEARAELSRLRTNN